MEEIPSPGAITLSTVQRFVDLATDALADAREEIDALNVYPVPDSDTGTNLHLTVSAARDALAQAVEEGGADPLEAFARGALMGARGNSGVILSEMLGAIARRLAGAGATENNAVVMADALHRAAEGGYAAVGTPVEGTMLSVARAAADAAGEALQQPPSAAGRGRVRARDVLVAAAAGARASLARTPEQLAVLAAAGVVDAGGRGVCVLLDAAETALTGRRPPPPPRGHHIPVPHPAHPLPATSPATGSGASAQHAEGIPAGERLTSDGPSYEVMYLLDSDEERVATLRRTLAGLGESLVVVGGAGLWNVHVHVDDVGAAVEAGIEAGRPHRVRVTHFAEQVRRQDGCGATREGRAVVAVTAGPGLAALFAEAGAVVVESGEGRPPSTADLLAAVTGCGAAQVVVLPNDGEVLRAALVAAETAENDEGMQVAVVETRTQVQGLAALAVHEPGRTFDRDVLEMTATARHVRHGAVTVAARRAMTMAGPCEAGDVLGVVAGDFVVIGDDLLDVATDVVSRLLGGGGELVTFVSGAGGEELAAAAVAFVEREHPYVDVTSYDGGQARYPLLVSVE